MKFLYTFEPFRMWIQSLRLSVAMLVSRYACQSLRLSVATLVSRYAFQSLRLSVATLVSRYAFCSTFLHLFADENAGTACLVSAKSNGSMRISLLR